MPRCLDRRSSSLTASAACRSLPHYCSRERCLDRCSSLCLALSQTRWSLVHCRCRVRSRSKHSSAKSGLAPDNHEAKNMVVFFFRHIHGRKASRVQVGCISFQYSHLISQSLWNWEQSAFKPHIIIILGTWFQFVTSACRNSSGICDGNNAAISAINTSADATPPIPKMPCYMYSILPGNPMYMYIIHTHQITMSLLLRVQFQCKGRECQVITIPTTLHIITINMQHKSGKG